MEAMHFGWESGVPSDEEINPDRFKKENIQINQITSFLLKLRSRIAVLKMRRMIDSYEGEPIMGIIPALALSEMWQTISYVEQILFLVSLCVLLVGILSILISLYTSINERRREMAILRSLGARSIHIFTLLIYESMILVVSGVVVGVGMLYGLLYFVRPWLESNFSVYMEITALNKSEWYIILGIILCGILAGLIPAIKAYRNSLQDGLTIKI
jgi:putative ABC transport system permease protein